MESDIRHVMAMIATEYPRFQVTDARVAMWNESLGSHGRSALEDATRAVLETARGTPTLGMLAQALHRPTVATGEQRDCDPETIFKVIVSECIPGMYDPYDTWEDLVAKYRAWRNSGYGSEHISTPSAWVPEGAKLIPQHLAPPALIRHCDIVAGHVEPTSVEFIP